MEGQRCRGYLYKVEEQGHYLGGLLNIKMDPRNLVGLSAKWTGIGSWSFRLHYVSASFLYLNQLLACLKLFLMRGKPLLF
jgi:hypothetical protein